MNNNNPKKSSPLDEIKRITKDAGVPASKRRPVPSREGANTTPAPAPKAAPSAKPAAASRPEPAPVPKAVSTAAKKPMTNNTPEIPAVQAAKSAPSKPKSQAPDQEIAAVAIAQDGTSRAEKVRQARENAQRSRMEAQKTQVMTNITPEAIKADAAKSEESKKNEAERATASKEDNSQTRISDTVHEKPATKKAQENTSAGQTKEKKKKSKKEKGAISDEFEETVGKGLLSNTLKAVIYLVSIFVVSGCLSIFTILVANDCFAFVKNDAEVVINIPDGADLDQIADILHDNDIIKYPRIFKLYIDIRNKETDEYLSGDFVVSPAMSYDTLISAFKPYTIREEITVTITEGMSTQDIIDLFVSKGVGTQEGFKEAINNVDYDFWFLEGLTEEKTEDRYYRLDGYLFPDTYNVFTDAKEEDIIYKLLANFDAKFAREDEALCEALGKDLDEIIILASMIQNEAKSVNYCKDEEDGASYYNKDGYPRGDYYLVSAVFHNRLHNPSTTGGKLESDATVLYAMRMENSDMSISEANRDFDTPYNTYLYPGLPAGPICNPSLDAIRAAMNPDREATDFQYYEGTFVSGSKYYFFVSDIDGYNYYAKSKEGHDQWIAEVMKHKEEAAAES